MTDEVFRPRKPQISDLKEDEGNPLEHIREVQQAISRETGKEFAMPADAPFQVSGNIPPEFKQALSRQKSFQGQDFTPEASVPSPMRGGMSADLEEILSRVSAHTHQWEPIKLPSKSKFYGGEIPETIFIRAMTGEEEKILATPRFVKKGQAIDMIFSKCIRERIPVENLLSVDKIYLLIFLRGISYTPEYDVEIKCPECTTKFTTVIDLNSLDVEECPGDFGPQNLTGVLPTTGLQYRYRLPTGHDEQEITKHRERFVKNWGDQKDDDTLQFRMSLLLEQIENLTNKQEIQMLLNKLPINDLTELRNIINNPPFGVETEVGIVCPMCSGEFEIELPLEANFFFPRKKREKIQV
jgi:hypothetical protein